MLKKPTGSYDERGRRLDPPAPLEGEAPSTAMTASTASPQEIYVTAIPLTVNGYVVLSDYRLRVTWTQPPVVGSEYIYLYDHEPPAVGSEAGGWYTWEYAKWYSINNTDEEASYYFLATGPQGSLEYVSTYWAAYVRYISGKYIVVARSRLQRPQANWMANVYRDHPAWGSLHLNQIFLPGTHDSGTFNMVDIGIPNVYNQTQELTFVRQLDAGVRWLDIRMGYYEAYENGREGPFFTVHATYGSWSAWSTALNDIKAWMQATPTEIVFFNFKWEGPTSDKVKIVKDPNGDDQWVWEESLKTRVLKMTYDALNGFGVLPRSEHATITMKEMINTPYRVVMGTASTYDPVIPGGADPVCPGIDYDWFNKYYITELIPELNKSLSTPRTWMWGSGTVLTPHPYDGTIPWGVYSLTTDAIDRMNHWIRINAGQLNIVPVDFIDTNVALALVEQFNKARP